MASGGGATRSRWRQPWHAQMTLGFRLVGLRRGQLLCQFLWSNLALADLGEFDDEVDDLLFVERRAQLDQSLRRLLVVLDHLLLLPGVAPGLVDDGATQLVVGDLDL